MLIDLFRYILFHFTFSHLSSRRRKMTYMWNLYFLSYSGCYMVVRDDKTRLKWGWVYFYNLIMRYIIPRIWAWKFHSIVENLIWYFFLFPRCSPFFHQNEGKARSREFSTLRRWDLVGNCISIPFVLPACQRFIFIYMQKKMTSISLLLHDIFPSSSCTTLVVVFAVIVVCVEW